MVSKGKNVDDEPKSKAETVILLLIAAVVLLFILAYAVPRPTTETTKAGIKVVSEFPLEKLRSLEYIALYNTTTSPAELTCKFELSAISKPDIRGYRISIGEGDTGIYLKAKSAEIKGRTQEDILNACHLFACMRDGIECQDFDGLWEFFNNAGSMSVILDERAGKESMKGYGEIMAAASFMQIKRADLNRDGSIDQAEVNANEYFIYPFLKQNDTCIPQPLNNELQNWSRTNRTSLCANIRPAILITNSNSSSIRVLDGQVVLTGDDQAVHTGAIVLRDYIAPEFVRRLYGFD